MTGVKFLLKVTMRRLDLAAEVYHLKEPQKIPVVLSPDEVKLILTMAPSLKARTMLTISYGCGLRAGEVARLRVSDIDRAQKIKGPRDECVLLRRKCHIRRARSALQAALWMVIAINAAIFLVEIVAGVVAGSQALRADALDFLGDTLTKVLTNWVPRIQGSS
jgi:site-specific recombinase XerC